MMTAELREQSLSRTDRHFRAASAAMPGDRSELLFEGMQDEWQIRQQTLQEWICVLLIKNQQLRTELMEVKAKLLRKEDECGA